MKQKTIFVGDIVSPKSLNDINCRTSGFLEVEDGIITDIGTTTESKPLRVSDNTDVRVLGPNQFLMPGFVDCHTHAPQFPNIGLGLDRPLLEWLDKYTFPLESQYSDKEFAASVYDQVVRRLLKNGTTTACYFGSIHLEGTLELVNSVIKHNQRALVGKVSMNIKNDAGYFNDTKKELEEVETFVNKVYNCKNDLVQPIVTPRFAVSCDKELMKQLSQIANRYQCGIQSHISENQKEIEHVLEKNPCCSCYSDVYEKCGIFDEKCIMAHAIYLSEKEMSIFSRKGISIAHCPASNTRLKSGLCPVRKLLNNKIKVGLGTDVSGGDNASILDAIRRTMDVSEHLHLLGAEESALNWKEALYLATLGGAEALHLNDKIGSFEIGKQFDALLIDLYAKDSPVDKFDYSVAINKEENLLDKVQRFIYLGDDRNIVQVFVKGKKVKDINMASTNVALS
ncbi:unnamed protein product, partial [Brenthis ino]